MSVLVVIVNYRTPGLTIDCLKSLAPQITTIPGGRAIVTDNASPDDSVNLIRQAIIDLGFDTWCTFMPLTENGGFAYGNNAAIRAALSHLPDADGTGPTVANALPDGKSAKRGLNDAHAERAKLAEQFQQSGHAEPVDQVEQAQLPDRVGQTEIVNDPDFVWLLNPDTIVLDGALPALIDFMRSHPAVGIAGGRAENTDGSVRRSCFRFHSPLGELEGSLQFAPASKVLRKYIVAPAIPQSPAKIDWVSGASMMVRRSVFEQIGLLDDRYFMYFEETDFCLRASRAGFECWYVPASRIIHLVGQSSGVTGAKRSTKRRPKYWFDSRRRYFGKNFGRATGQAANLLWLVGYPLGRAWQAVRGKPRQDPPLLWWDFLRYNYLRSGR